MTQKGMIVLAGLLGVLIGALGAWLGFPLATEAVDYFGTPRVTVMNATGDDISAVTVTLGSVRQRLSDLKDGHAKTVTVRGQFGECSTRVSWSDSIGAHDESANDYMENHGFYHAKIVLTPDRKAKAIYEIQESSQPALSVKG